MNTFTRGLIDTVCICVWIGYFYFKQQPRQVGKIINEDCDWAIPEVESGTLPVTRNKACIFFWRTKNKNQSRILIVELQSRLVIIFHIPQKCNRLVFRHRYHYQRSTKTEPVRSVNACFLQTIYMFGSPETNFSFQNDEQCKTTANGDYSFNTAHGVVEIPQKGGIMQRINLKGFTCIERAWRVVSSIYHETKKRDGLKFGHTQLNLLILDASSGIPLDINHGGFVESRVHAILPGVVIRHEEPDFNCHMLVSISCLSDVDIKYRRLSQFKADISITRLGKFIFRISTLKDDGQTLNFTEKLQEDIMSMCDDIFKSLCRPM